MQQLLKKYDLNVGLEIHVELNTKTKLVCGCANLTSSQPNTNCCPVCLAYPNSVPRLNKAAVEKTIIAGLATNCKINPQTFWERKCYFYPDMPAGYQTSQNLMPVCVDGSITLSSGKVIRIKQIHLEEDAGKLVHSPATGESFVDLNRGGVPLIEIVTKPDIASAEEAAEFLEEVRSRLMFSGVADVKMEEGGLRCDVNLSLSEKGTGKLGVRTETKNLNSFKNVAAAINFEAKRQAQALESGQQIQVETRRWDDQTLTTSAMRLKQTAQYVVAPNMPIVKITDKQIESLKSKMPMLAYQLKNKFINEFDLPEYDANVLTKTKEIANFYLQCATLLNQPKKISNWLMVDLLKAIKDAEGDFSVISPAHFTEIIKLVEEKLVTKTVGLQLLDQVIKTKQAPGVLAKQMNLFSTVSEQQIEDILKQLEADNPKVIEDYKVNSEKVLKFIIGHVMKQTKGKAKSEVVEKLIKKLFN